MKVSELLGLSQKLAVLQLLLITLSCFSTVLLLLLFIVNFSSTFTHIKLIWWIKQFTARVLPIYFLNLMVVGWRGRQRRKQRNKWMKSNFWKADRCLTNFVCVKRKQFENSSTRVIGKGYCEWQVGYSPKRVGGREMGEGNPQATRQYKKFFVTLRMVFFIIYSAAWSPTLCHRQRWTITTLNRC